jgi:hypothetical protein
VKLDLPEAGGDALAYANGHPCGGSA